MDKKRPVRIPGAKCNFCNSTAEYDGPLVLGGWAYVCGNCTWRLAWSIKNCTKIDAALKEEQDDDNT